MGQKVTDPALLQQLNGGSSPKKVTDPAVLQQLNAGASAPAPTAAGNPYLEDLPYPGNPTFKPEDPKDWRRGTLAPVERNETTGELRLAWPQAALDLGNAVMLPADTMAGKVGPEENFSRNLMFGAAFAGGGAKLPGKMAAAEAPVVLAKAAAPKTGYKRPATEAIVRGLIADGALGPEGMEALRLSGDNAMLADAGPATRGILDTAIQRSGPGATAARNAVETRAAQAGPTIERALDEALGTPVGVQTAETGIRKGGAGARDATYEAAYSQPIDYSSEAGMAVEALLPRVPKGVIELANRMMQVGGDHSRQILAKVADDGTVTFLRMPDVRQLDYITRALNQAATSGEGQGALGGQTTIGRLFGNLAREIRDQTRAAVPEYDTALRTAADPIRQREALRFGEGLLSPTIPRDEAREVLSAMTGPELQAARQGLRSYVDEVVANVKSVVSDPNLDARQARKALQDLSSAAAREKVRLILGDEAIANRLFAELYKARKSLELKADTANNSKTFGRQATEEAVNNQIKGGMVNSALRGEPVNAAKAFIQNLTGRTPQGEQAMKDSIYEEIAQMATLQGPEAMDLLKLLSVVNQNKVVNPQSAALPPTFGAVVEGTRDPLTMMRDYLLGNSSGR